MSADTVDLVFLIVMSLISYMIGCYYGYTEGYIDGHNGNKFKYFF